MGRGEERGVGTWGLGCWAAGAGISCSSQPSALCVSVYQALERGVTGVCSSGQSREGAVTSAPASVSLRSKVKLHQPQRLCVFVASYGLWFSKHK